MASLAHPHRSHSTTECACPNSFCTSSPLPPVRTCISGQAAAYAEVTALSCPLRSGTRQVVSFPHCAQPLLAPDLFLVPSLRVTPTQGKNEPFSSPFESVSDPRTCRCHSTSCTCAHDTQRVHTGLPRQRELRYCRRVELYGRGGLVRPPSP